MAMTNYNEIKQNIIDNFLIPYYKYTSTIMRETIISNIHKRSWFPFEYNMETNVMTINLGNDVIITIEFIFIDKGNYNVLMDFK